MNINENIPKKVTKSSFQKFGLFLVQNVLLYDEMTKYDKSS